MPPFANSTAVNLNSTAAPVRSNLRLASSNVKPTLCQGSRGAAVEGLQRKLSELGHSPGRADGVFGPNTRAAVRDFQRAQGLSVDGVVGSQTWSALGTAQPSSAASSSAASHADRGRGSSPPSAPVEHGGLSNETLAARAASTSNARSAQSMLRQGARGPEVEQLQSKLSQLGYNPGRADGIFGRRTLAAVRGFQRAQGLSADGIVGPNTRAALANPQARPAGTTGSSASSGAAANTPTGRGTANDFVNHALAQRGDRYIYGAETRLNDPNPNTFDCSELVQWAGARAGVNIPDGSANQLAHVRRNGQEISVAQAMRTRGALLFRPGHVAISLGDGRTIEARGRNYGVNIFNAAGRFTSAGLVPGMTY